MSPRTPTRQLQLPAFPDQRFALAQSRGWCLHRASDGELWACRYDGPEDHGQPYKANRYTAGDASLPRSTQALFREALAGLTAGIQ